MICSGLYSRDAYKVFVKIFSKCNSWWSESTIAQDPGSGEVTLPGSQTKDNLKIISDEILHVILYNWSEEITSDDRAVARVIIDWLRGKSLSKIASKHGKEIALRVVGAPFDPITSELFSEMTKKMEAAAGLEMNLIRRFSWKYLPSRTQGDEEKFWRISDWIRDRVSLYVRRLEDEFKAARASLLIESELKDRSCTYCGVMLESD